MSGLEDGGASSGGSPGSWAIGTSIDVETSLALARACVRALIKLSPDAAGTVRAELRKEAVGLEMKGGAHGHAAATALRRILDDAGQ